MLATLPASTLAEWERFYRLEPFGAEADELRLGQISATLANINRSRNTKHFLPSDFLLTVSRPQAPEQTVQEQYDTFMSLFGNVTKH